MGAGRFANSSRWFCHAVPRLPLEVRILLEQRIGVRGQQLAVRVDVHAAARRLVEHELEVQQVVPRHHDERPRLDRARHLRGLGRAERLGVGLVEQLHAAQVHLAHAQRERQQLVRAGLVVGERSQTLVKESRHRLVAVAEHGRVVGIGGYAAQAEQHERLKRAHILRRVPQEGQIVVGSGLHAERGGDAVALGVRSSCERTQRCIIEIDVGERGEQAFHCHVIGLVAHRRLHAFGRFRRLHRECETYKCAGQLVLHLRCGRRLAAHTRRAHAPGASGSLLALEAEHRGVHTVVLPFVSRHSRPHAGRSREFLLA